jgi:hypothetical protein
MSSEQLAEHIMHADKLTPLKLKIAPVKKAEECVHPAARLTNGSNQFAAWVTCMDCHSRWKIPMIPRAAKQVKKEKVKKEKSASPVREVRGPASNPELAALKEECERLRGMEQMSRRLRREHQEEHSLLVEELKTQMKAEQKTQRMEMQSMREALEIREVMMTEYASMALGSQYKQETKGYHDSEMYTYAKNQLDNQREIAQLEALQHEINRANQSAAAGVPVPTEGEWDISMTEPDLTAGVEARARVKKTEQKTRSTSKPRRHGFD